MQANESGSPDVEPAEAERLVREGSVRVLDVRTPEEYEGLGHIPGALLLPVDVIPCAPATLPREGKPLLVCCEHGVRSAFAARFLAQAGYDGVRHMAGGMSRWSGPRERAAWDPRQDLGPSSWLLENADLLPRGGSALDLACGAGRHALLLAAAGLRVRAVDRDAEKIASLRATAARLGLALEAEILDLEAAGADLGEAGYDLILGIHYLHRPLFPAIRRALARGGILLYETFTVDQAARGGPTNPDFLLRPGELRRLVEPLEVVRERQGEYEGRMVAGVVARRTA
jgi:rhodanese-related sulfurtransferase